MMFPRADLCSLLIKHFSNRIEKLRANIALETVDPTSTLVTEIYISIFSLFEKVTIHSKQCILKSAKSCDLHPISYKLLIQYIDSIISSLTNIYNSFLASGIFPQYLKSAVVTPTFKKCFDQNDLYNYQPV